MRPACTLQECLLLMLRAHIQDRNSLRAFHNGHATFRPKENHVFFPSRDGLKHKKTWNYLLKGCLRELAFVGTGKL
jgi:hypothetical protein